MRSIEQALAELRRDPARAVQARVDGLIVELRAVTPPPTARSAADLFAQLGPWEGETTEEVLGLLAEARRSGGVRNVTAL